jgi:peroxiredoxin
MYTIFRKLFPLLMVLSLTACSSSPSETKQEQVQNPQPAQKTDTVQSIQGTSLAVDQLLGKENVLAFFYTYGTPCLNTFPELQKVASTCQTTKIIGIESTGQPDAKALQVVDTLKITFPLLNLQSAKKTTLFSLFQVRSLPTLLFIDKQKKVTPYIGQMSQSQIEETLQKAFSIPLSEC